MSRSNAHYARALVNTSQGNVPTSSELFAVSDVHDTDVPELDDHSIAMLISFFMLLDRWDREGVGTQ
jgi:hypothetical protein